MPRNKLARRTHLRRFYAALKGQQAPFLTRVNWVANHLYVPFTEIPSDAPPDYASICLLAWAVKNENEFRSVYDGRLIPSKSDLEKTERIKDDGRTLGILEALHADLEKNHDRSPDRPSSEPAIPTESVPPLQDNQEPQRVLLGQDEARRDVELL